MAALPAAGAEAGASVTFTATVTPDDAAGTVQFRDGTSALGAPVAVTAGVATLTTTGLSVGDHSITAEFVPSAGHAGSTSVAVAYGIVAAPLASGAAWGLSNYLNSANFGRPNPSPTNYGAPATFNATTRISTWAEGSTTTNPDGTVTLAFEGSSVNHAKTGGGWLRIAELEATLDKSGNGVVSGVVSYGTMSPPDVFDPATPPVRGPVRVDLVELTGNAAAPTAVPGGATWGGLSGLWSAEFLTFLAGDGGASPAWAYATTVTNTGASAVDRKPSAFNFTLDALPTFVEYGNEAKWGLSSYLNSANMGRPNPSPANYGAPATFDAASAISTWGDGAVVSNDDRTVTVSYEGSSVNHAKTGGGWLRIADVEATLDESGNGTVSGVVSYGTMAPPSIFNPATPPVRGPERVDLVTLSGNSAELTVTPAGAAWSGLSGGWNEDVARLPGRGFLGDPCDPGLGLRVDGDEREHLHPRPQAVDLHVHLRRGPGVHRHARWRTGGPGPDRSAGRRRSAGHAGHPALGHQIAVPRLRARSDRARLHLDLRRCRHERLGVHVPAERVGDRPRERARHRILPRQRAVHRPRRGTLGARRRPRGADHQCELRCALGRHGDGTRRLRDPRPRLRDAHGRCDRRDQLHRGPGDSHGRRCERVRRLLQRGRRSRPGDLHGGREQSDERKQHIRPLGNGDDREHAGCDASRDRRHRASRAIPSRAASSPPPLTGSSRTRPASSW